MRRLLLTGITLAALGLAATASAQTAVTTMDVTMTVNATCNVTANPLAFPATLVDGAAPTAITTVNVTCSTGIPFDIAMDAGANFGAASRRMWDGSANYIAYNINLPDNSGAWGDANFDNTFPTGTEWSGTGTNAPLPFNVRGSVTGAGPYVPGSYSDQVTVTVHF